jgi:Raf kinase inhibitor-like YbhB/YbcL family protein
MSAASASLEARQGSEGRLNVTSSLFTNDGRLPESIVFNGLGRNGRNISPDLRWSGASSNTRSYVVTCYDPDAPTTVGFWHWLMFNIPASVTSLGTDVGRSGKNPPGSVMGYTDFGSNEYSGPAPAPGSCDHYHFTVYALDVEKLNLGPGTTGALLMFNARSHTLAMGTLIGLYGD